METAEVDQFDSSSCETFFFRLWLNVDLSINDLYMVISLSTDSDKNNESVKNGGLVIFLGD